MHIDSISVHSHTNLDIRFRASTTHLLLAAPRNESSAGSYSNIRAKRARARESPRLEFNSIFGFLPDECLYRAQRAGICADMCKMLERLKNRFGDAVYKYTQLMPFNLGCAHAKRECHFKLLVWSSRNRDTLSGNLIYIDYCLSSIDVNSNLNSTGASHKSLESTAFQNY